MFTYRTAVGIYFKDTAELQYCKDNITVFLGRCESTHIAWSLAERTSRREN